MNNPISLHFYSPEERLPEDEGWKIVICFNEDNNECGFTIAYYCKDFETWLDDECLMINVVAWASFSPEWVIQQKQEE